MREGLRSTRALDRYTIFTMKQVGDKAAQQLSKDSSSVHSQQQQQQQQQQSAQRHPAAYRLECKPCKWCRMVASS